jgi:glycerol uptake facilitator-like aquaporin
VPTYNASSTPPAQAGSVQTIVCQVFGAACSQALAVAACESGYSTTAVNGQYEGIFQMGSNERAIYGNAYTALGQAEAAYRYFVASGRDWSPWSCKP